MPAQPGGGRVSLGKHLPGPLGLVWRFIGAPRHARFRAARDGHER
ncbi:hypothetical protein [Actinoplanes subtropicus]|nr:hypothetical protein [Actinoplanes subtropicus]